MGGDRLFVQARYIAMIVTHSQSRLQDWLCTRLERSCSPNMRCIGNVQNGKIVAVVGIDDWDSASAQIHVAGFGNWVTRDFLWAVFSYAFVQAGINVLYGLIPEVNSTSRRFAKHVGFKESYMIPDAHQDGGLMLVTLRKQDCKYMNREVHYGQESQNACCA